MQGGRGGLGGVSASGGVIILHARSVKCGKLENGCWVHVLVVRHMPRHDKSAAEGVPVGGHESAWRESTK